MNTDEGLPVGILPGDRKHMGEKSQRLAASPLQVSLPPVGYQLIFLLFLPFLGCRDGTYGSYIPGRS